jgi:hypothetical protein
MQLFQGLILCDTVLAAELTLALNAAQLSAKTSAVRVTAGRVINSYVITPADTQLLGIMAQAHTAKAHRRESHISLTSSSSVKALLYRRASRSISRDNSSLS